MLEVTGAVQCLYSAGILHRDIRPWRIGFTRQEELKMLDLGLARREDEITISGVPGHGIVGTPAYMSPEALRRALVCPEFDLWALAVVFYEALTGRLPFEGSDHDSVIRAILEGRLNPITSLLPGCEKRLREFCRRGLNLEAERRPSSASELASLLEALQPALN